MKKKILRKEVFICIIMWKCGNVEGMRFVLDFKYNRYYLLFRRRRRYK